MNTNSRRTGGAEVVDEHGFRCRSSQNRHAFPGEDFLQRADNGHELGAEAFLRLILARSRGEISDETYRQGIKATLIEQDKDLSVAPTYGYIICELYAEFPEVRGRYPSV